MSLRTVLVCLLSWTAVSPGWAALAGEPNWPQFRGPHAAGVSTNAGLPDTWSATENVAWKTDLPGRSWSSPIVWGNRVFLTAVVNSGTSEEPKKGLYFGGNRPEPPKAEHEWKVLGLDLATGKVSWERTVHRGAPQTSIHLKSSYGAETPVTDGERVYALFGNLGVFAFTLDGAEAWSQRLEPRKTRFGWGTAASPVLHGGRLFLVNDNEDKSELLALDARTGKEAWRVNREEASNWVTPFVWENRQRTELVTCGSRAVRSYDLEGRLLWSFEGMSSIAIRRRAPAATSCLSVRATSATRSARSMRSGLARARTSRSGPAKPATPSSPGPIRWAVPTIRRHSITKGACTCSMIAGW